MWIDSEIEIGSDGEDKDTAPTLSSKLKITEAIINCKIYFFQLFVSVSPIAAQPWASSPFNAGINP